MYICSVVQYRMMSLTDMNFLKYMVLTLDPWNFSFFGRGDVSPTHSELCRFVSGS